MVCAYRVHRVLVWRLWHHDYDIIESGDTINDATNRRTIGTFLQDPY